MSNDSQTMVHPLAVSRISNLRLVIGGVGLVLGVIAVFAMLTGGHATFNTSSTLVWGLPVSSYLFFTLTSTGLSFVASLAMVFGMKDFYPIAKRCVWGAIITLIAGFISLGLEMGNPLRMLWAIPTNMAVSSPMWWMGLFYLSCLALMIWKFLLINKGDWDSAQSRKIGIGVFVAEIVALATLGLVFGMMAMRPFWYDPMMPVYFLVAAALSGLAFIMLFINLDYGMDQSNMSEGTARAMTRQLPTIFAVALGLVIVFTVARITTGLWSNVAETRVVAQHIVWSLPFQFELWAGMVLPFFLMLGTGRSKAKVQVVAGGLVIVALFIDCYQYVVGGQLVPLFQGAWQDDLIAYTPSMTEIGVVVLSISVGMLLYAFGDKKLNLSDSPHQ